MNEHGNCEFCNKNGELYADTLNNNWLCIDCYLKFGNREMSSFEILSQKISFNQ